MSIGRSLLRKIDRRRAEELAEPRKRRGPVEVIHNDDDSVTIHLDFISSIGLYKLVLGILADDDEDADIIPRLQVPLSHIHD